MPLVAHYDLPSFERLRQEGQTVLEPDFAVHQDIRELHIGLLNMMPDAALGITERQFFRLVGESDLIAQFYLHPFTLDEIERGPEATEYVRKYYRSLDEIQELGLDALIISGANVTQPDLSQEAFWKPLGRIIDWSLDHVTSTLCSCLATHALLQFHRGIHRRRLPQKRWGVYDHWVVDRTHPVVRDVNTRFDVPHSRYNEIGRDQFEEAGFPVLVDSTVAGVHMATSTDGFRVVFLQGHPEYNTTSLLKEYKREVNRFVEGEREDYPPFPENYLSPRLQALLDEYHDRLQAARERGTELPGFPEALITPYLDNTWHDTAKAVLNNWVGTVYQTTHQDRKIAFRDGIDPDDPLGWRRRQSR